MPIRETFWIKRFAILNNMDACSPRLLPRAKCRSTVTYCCTDRFPTAATGDDAD